MNIDERTSCIFSSCDALLILTGDPVPSSLTSLMLDLLPSSVACPFRRGNRTPRRGLVIVGATDVCPSIYPSQEEEEEEEKKKKGVEEGFDVR